MKKITLSVIAAGLATASAAYAAAPTGAAPFQVVVPNLQAGPSITLEGLYLQPTNSDLVYASQAGASDNVLTNASLTPKYDWGFGVGLGYVFPQSGNDVQVNWQHFNQDSDASVSTASQFIQNASDISASTTTFKFDTVDLDVGQYLTMGTRFHTRLFAGLRYVDLQNDVTDTYSTVVGSNAPIVTGLDNYYSKFTGIGPRIGVDASYHVNSCFGVVSHLATAMLVGRVEDSANSSSINEAGGLSAPLVYSADDQTRVVPELDAKLGFDYTIPFKNQSSSSMTIEAGYQVTQYIDAIDRVHGSGNDAVSSSVGFNGPYLNLNFKM